MNNIRERSSIIFNNEFNSNSSDVEDTANTIIIAMANVSQVKMNMAKDGNILEQNDKIFALAVRGAHHRCDATIWQTEHPKLMILEKGQPQVLSPKMPLLSARNTDFTAAIHRAGREAKSPTSIERNTTP